MFAQTEYNYLLFFTYNMYNMDGKIEQKEYIKKQRLQIRVGVCSRCHVCQRLFV